MAITIGSSTNSGKVSNVNTSFSFNHTCDPGTTVLVVMVGAFDAAVGDMDVTGVSYGGNALTPEVGSADAVAGNFELWYRPNPTTESELAVQVTFNAKTSNASATAVDLIGVDGGDPVQASQRTTGSNSDPSVTVAGAADG